MSARRVGFRYVILGNLENRRVALFQEALRDAGRTPAITLSWEQFLDAPGSLEALLQPGDLLRIESPGESFPVEVRLLEWGLARMPEGAERIDAPRELGTDHGRIRAPAQYFAGLSAALNAVERSVEVRGAVCLNPPADILLMSDKARTHALLTRCALPVPPSLSGVGNYEELRAQMTLRGWNRVFVKLNTGSSASGVVALQVGRGRVLATTSVEAVHDSGGWALYNSLRIRRYDEEAKVARIIDTLAREGLHVERWIPKAAVNGRVVDLRIVVIAGDARHAVVRASGGPLTNLHLGNARGDLHQVRTRIGDQAFQHVFAVAAEVGDVCPRSLHVGVDMMIAARTHLPFVAEVNAFGDLLPNVRVDDRSTYEEQVRAIDEGRFPRQPALKAALFDLDNTLIDRDGAARDALATLARERGCDVGLVADAFEAENRLGLRERRELCEAVVTRTPTLAPTGEDLERELVKRLPGHVAAVPDIARGLEDLARRIEVGIVTDGATTLQRAKIAAAGLDRFWAITSEELGAEKPHGAVFRRALQQAACAPTSAMFVGDNPAKDIAGAATEGLRTCWISRGRAWPALPRGSARPDWVCHTVAAAIERLLRWT